MKKTLYIFFNFVCFSFIINNQLNDNKYIYSIENNYKEETNDIDIQAAPTYSDRMNYSNSD